MKYLVIYECDAEGCSAYVPDLPGCVAAARTRAEAAALIREAIALHIAGMREDGELLPEPTATADYVAVA